MLRRAVRRCGELLKEYDGKGNNQHSTGTDTKRDAADDAGTSANLIRDNQHGGGTPTKLDMATGAKVGAPLLLLIQAALAASYW